MRPRILKGVARQAETVEHIVRGTMYGPMRRTPALRALSIAVIWLAMEPPPEPATSPVREQDTSSGASPASAIASAIAT